MSNKLPAIMNKHSDVVKSQAGLTVSQTGQHFGTRNNAPAVLNPNADNSPKIIKK